MNRDVRAGRTPISSFGWLAVVWAGAIAGLLSGAFQRNVIGTTRILLLAVFLLALIVGIERVRVALARQRRDREQLKQSARRFSV